MLFSVSIVLNKQHAGERTMWNKIAEFRQKADSGR